MAHYVIDVNLPYRFSLWAGSDHIHVRDINDEWTDTEIWEYARSNKLTIVTKDADFSDRILLAEPPPRVIHVKLGNLTLRQLHAALHRVWEEVLTLSTQYKLIRIYDDRVECIG